MLKKATRQTNFYILLGYKKTYQANLYTYEQTQKANLSIFERKRSKKKQFLDYARL